MCWFHDTRSAEFQNPDNNELDTNKDYYLNRNTSLTMKFPIDFQQSKGPIYVKVYASGWTEHIGKTEIAKLKLPVFNLLDCLVATSSEINIHETTNPGAAVMSNTNTNTAATTAATTTKGQVSHIDEDDSRAHMESIANGSYIRWFPLFLSKEIITSEGKCICYSIYSCFLTDYFVVCHVLFDNDTY